MGEAHDREAVLRLLVVHCVPPREGTDIQGHRHLSAHGVDVAHGIHRRDGPEAVCIVDHGRKEVRHQNERPVRTQPVHGGIVADLESYELIVVLHSEKHSGKEPQNLRQGIRSPFRRSSSRRCHGCEPDLFP